MRAVTTLCGSSSGSQVLAGGVSERQPPPPTHPPPFGKQGNSRSLQRREELGGGARAPDEGIQKPPIGGSQRARTCESWLVRSLDWQHLSWRAVPLWCCAPPLAGGCPPRAAERVRARPTPVRCPPARPRTLAVSGRAGAAEVTAGRRGGGSMAASLWLRGAASGLRYWSRRQRPAAASLAAGKDLAPPSPSLLRPPTSRDLTTQEVFFTGGATVGSGLTTSHFGWSQGLVSGAAVFPSP